MQPLKMNTKITEALSDQSKHSFKIYILNIVSLKTLFYILLQTYVGDILIAVNPFKDIDIYGNHVSIY